MTTASTNDKTILMPFKPAKISLPTLDGYYFVNPDDIIRCAASGSYTVFHFKDKTKITVSLRLKICEAKLSHCSFFRIHHSHIVNLNFVSRYVRAKSGYIILSDGTQVEVAASRKQAFLDIMNG